MVDSRIGTRSLRGEGGGGVGLGLALAAGGGHVAPVPQRDGVEPFSPAEADQIRAMLVASNSTVVCPRCRGALKFATVPGADLQTAVWELECGACQRRLVVSERAE
jgi:hypothetical protein